ncbi:amidohydrolase [Pseudomonas sp. FW306-02-F02-AA]|uniref:Amidohydrolase n=1 Tax=Pseudomonas fluorescens TaxID=294 RepID=A0A0N9WRW9_PSEFL|nr:MULTISPECIES: M20 aminoacylase family protein [Pseudomonas]ALI04897.1 amidohydrolase [Pseudomonas fluorescens]PMZ05619.1 amidohydrolase [Pseudomonas sp. FW306-02-F02-AB]PMZ11188.1 amidohydrolase [Pseudomonas sp. FW306-02-H06C]PMZ17143.1 amidohydrolase [Pseudomonas sp. FW306-02-F02-AA]PMZ23389.1 amidohydrolase [Pseudomonas sp. FW306-02-F08-AA]
MNAGHVLPGIAALQDEMITLRQRIHAHPELGFEEFSTSELVAQCLTQWGYDVSTGVGKTGVVGTLKNGEGRSLGLRADMDALPIQEATGLPYASRIDGVMHACGHDGHTATLLAAAKYLAQTREFNGTLNLVFQPAEEGLGGAKKMLEDGLFERFPCDAIFAMHNIPGYPAGQLGFYSGPFMASADTVTIKVIGTGGHGAVPHKSVDPVVVCASIVIALQSIVSRNVNPQETAIITVGSIHAGNVSNVIPASAEMILSVRALTPEVRQLLERRITDLVNGQAASFGAQAEIDYYRCHPVLINDPEQTAFARQVAREWLGEGQLIEDLRPFTASEDFAFILEQCPGSYLVIGNGQGEGSCLLHNPGYDFNDACLPIGASYWVKLAEGFLR